MAPGLGTGWSSQDYCGRLAGGAGAWGQGAVWCCGLLLDWAHILKLESVMGVEGFRERRAKDSFFFFLNFLFCIGV